MKHGNRKLKRLLPFFLLLTILFTAVPSFAQLNLPTPTKEFYYYDEMGVMSQDTKEEILKTNIELQGKTKAQVVVATVNDLQQYPIEDYSLEMFRKWGIGDKELNNGILILLGKEPTNDKFSVFINVGYGLEGRLNDGKVGRILDEYFIPTVDRNDPTSFDRALIETFRATISQVILEYGVELDGNYQEYIDNLNTAPRQNGWLIFLVFVILIMISMNSRGPRGPRGRRRYRGYYPRGGFGGFGGYSSGSSGRSSGGFGGFSGGGGSSGGGGAGRSF